jgi:hypothetical protein
MESLDKTKLIISLRNIIRVLGITEKELFGGVSTTETPEIKTPTLKIDEDINTPDDDFMSPSGDMTGFLSRHPDSSINLTPSEQTKTDSKTPSLNTIDNNVDPALVDDDFGGK